MATALPGETLDRHLLSQRFRPLAHVVWARQADASVLLDADRGVYYTLNEVATRTWELLAAGEPVIEILRCLSDEFDVPLGTLEGDTATLLSELLEARLVERSGI